jgi:hypothetical protein
LVVGKRKRNVLQVVDSRTTNPNEVLHGDFSITRAKTVALVGSIGMVEVAEICWR